MFYEYIDYYLIIHDYLLELTSLFCQKCRTLMYYDFVVCDW